MASGLQARVPAASAVTFFKMSLLVTSLSLHLGPRRNGHKCPTFLFWAQIPAPLRPELPAERLDGWGSHAAGSAAPATHCGAGNSQCLLDTFIRFRTNYLLHAIPGARGIGFDRAQQDTQTRKRLSRRKKLAILTIPRNPEAGHSPQGWIRRQRGRRESRGKSLCCVFLWKEKGMAGQAGLRFLV